jgi:anti-anti-sigma factor
VIDICTCAESTIVCPSGDIDMAGSTELRHLIGDLLVPGVNVVIDLRHVNYAEAIGLSALVGSVRRVRSVGGRTSIRNANPRLRWHLGLIGADRLLVPPSTVTPRQGVA